MAFVITVLLAAGPLAVLMPGVNILMAIVGLGAVIFVHELGHFLVAKACGVKCEKFYLGFDAFDVPLGPITIPAKLVHFQWGETEYGIGILPLGGYVKMLGQDDNPQAQEEENERIKVPVVHKSDVKLAGKESGGETEQEKEIGKGLAAEGLTGGKAIGEKKPTSGDAEEPERQYQLDPRSYQAKPVWQRMLIISAGVIFNVIFAVIFATIAYAIGVPYTPAEVGDTVPGSPAWVADLRPGDKIVRIGKEGHLNEHLRFQHDLIQDVAMASLAGESLDFEFLRNGQTMNVTLRPRSMTSGLGIGVFPPGTLTLGDPPTMPGMPAAAAEPGFAAGDVLVAVKAGSERHAVKSMGDLKQVLAQHPGESLTFFVARSPEPAEGSSAVGETPAQEVAIDVKPNPYRNLGIVMQMGEIAAVQKDSPAEKAGLARKDKMLSIGGKPIPDPLLLDQWLKPHWDQEVDLEFERVDSAGKVEKKIVKVKVRAPRTYDVARAGEVPVGSDALGVAYWVTNEVAAVSGPAAAGEKPLKPGDRIVQMEIVPGDEAEREALKKRGVSLEKIRVGPDDPSWPALMSAVQLLPPKTTVKLRYHRTNLHYVDLKPAASDTAFNPQRGIPFESKTEIHQADSLAEALSLGLRETGESLLRVVGFLRALFVTPQVAKHTGSVLTIFAQATGEASVGPTRLLVFLTLLSANLAVINILPIPVLDGGHLVFLAAEGIRGKPVDEGLQIRLTVAGFVFLLCIMVLVFGMDILRFTGLGG